MTTPILPTYLSGKGGAVKFTIEGTTPAILPLPVTGWDTTAPMATFDATNATSQGYEDVEASTQSCTFTATAMWKRTGGKPPFRNGHIYFVELDTQPGEVAYSGNALVTGINSKSSIKGETSYTFNGQFKGVFNSPDYPTAISDAAGLTGDFAPPA